MRSWLQISIGKCRRFHTGFLTLLIAALSFGTIADALHPHDGDFARPQVQTARLVMDGSSGSAIIDEDCGIHPGCTAGLIPEEPAAMMASHYSARVPVMWKRLASAVGEIPDHVPIVS